MRQNNPVLIDSMNRNRRRGRGPHQGRIERGHQAHINRFPIIFPNTQRKKSNPQNSKKEIVEDAMQTHFKSILNCLKSAKKKQFLLQMVGLKQRLIESQKQATNDSSNSITKFRNSFISDFFFDIPSKTRQKMHSQSISDISKISYSSETRLDKKFGYSYFSLKFPPKYRCLKPHFADFICNSIYKVQDMREECENKKCATKKGENKKSESKKGEKRKEYIPPQPAKVANSVLSENIDMHSFKVIKYNKIFLDYLDPERRIKLAKSHQMASEDVLNYIVTKKIHLDELLHDMEDDKRFIYRHPISLSLNDPNISLPSFKLSSLHFLYYTILLLETQTTLTPHNSEPYNTCYTPISVCLKHFIPILLAVSQPVISRYNQTEYYHSLKAKLVDSSPKVLTSLSPFSNPSLFNKKIKELLSHSPQFSFTERDWPIHLLLPPLFVRYIIILFDLLDRLDEYLQEIPFIPFRASFGLINSVRADITLDSIPNEFKRLFESIEKGGSLAQKFYDLRNISYQIISVNGLNIFDRELKVIESCIKGTDLNNPKRILTEDILLNKMRHDIIDQNPYKIKFIFNKTGEEISFKFETADKEKLRISCKFDETYVFPNYSIITLQPKIDPELVKYEGILKSNMTFSVSGSNDPFDDQFHVQFTEDSYGIICNYTNLI